MLIIKVQQYTNVSAHKYRVGYLEKYFIFALYAVEISCSNWLLIGLKEVILNFRIRYCFCLVHRTSSLMGSRNRQRYWRHLHHVPNFQTFDMFLSKTFVEYYCCLFVYKCMEHKGMICASSESKTHVRYNIKYTKTIRV